MASIIGKYNEIYKKIKAISDEIQHTNEAISALKSDANDAIPARIAHLEEQLKKIDEYLLKVQAFRHLAEQHISSKNVLTIEAPPNYRVNLNRLRRWAMMIDPRDKQDPSEPDDPYAQKVYLVATCDEFFLEKKKREFTEKVENLRLELNEDKGGEVQELCDKLDALRAELAEFCESVEVKAFAAEVVDANQTFMFKENRVQFRKAIHDPEYYVPGAYGLPFRFAEEQREKLKTQMGVFYNKDAGRVYLPVEKINPQQEFLMTVSCVPSREKVAELDAGLRNFLLNIIDKSPVGSRKICVLDAERQNTTLLGSVKQLQDTFAMDVIPKTKEQMTAAIEKIVASFSDIDEMIEEYDSVAEYNQMASLEKKITRNVLVLVGWPSEFDSGDKALMKRIIANYERYGVSLILVEYGETDYSNQHFGISEFDAEDVIHIHMSKKDTSISFGNGTPYKFAWYTFKGGLSSEYVSSLKEHTVEKKALGNEYINHFDMVNLPAYTRSYKKIELPFGIDNKEKVHQVSFENENFAAYLVGASRSGKSTLLHTLIAGLIRNYHPDNVELWLADFKQLEFEKYITNLPPHVKYVLLDESTELVYDLIDKLTEKMMERQHLFARLGKERIDQIDATKLDAPLPVIFVILDEFSIMSQAIADSPTYKLRLQNLLAKGAALGIRFLFSSQTFTTGVAGLTQTARAQIQQRISMKGSREEIGATLELSSNNKTEQVRNWMDALPPYYALIKSRKSADTPPEVNRVLVMYFKDYAVRNDMIRTLNQRMYAVDQYDPAHIDSYVDKHPVLVDGKVYELYSSDRFMENVNAKMRSADSFGDETFAAVGTPRLMESMKLLSFSAETRENLLLISRPSEQACTASIISSMAKSFQAQGKKVSIWAYGKNRLYRAYADSVWNGSEYAGLQIVEDADAICDAIYEMRQKIEAREASDELIVMLGMERICSDFEFADGGNAGSSERRESFEERRKQREEELKKKGAVVQSEAEMDQVKLAQAWIKYSKPLKAEYKAQGLTAEEMKQKLAEDRAKFMQEFTGQSASPAPAAAPAAPVQETPAAASPAETSSETAEKKHQPGAYNAKDDFLYIIKQGSRLGYHFMMVLNDYSDLKQTFTKLDFFRHRMAFQVSVEDSRALFSSRSASELPEHICQYYNTLDRFSFRPYLHRGVTWEGWYVNDEGQVNSPFVKKD